MACEAEAGESEPVLPAACTAAEGFELLLAEADWALAVCGVLRTALLLAADAAFGCALALSLIHI